MRPFEYIEHELIEMLGSRLHDYLPADGHENRAVWVGQVFCILTTAVASGDAQAIALACDFIEKDPMLPFGKLVKSNLSRALKKRVGQVLGSERGQVMAATAKLLNLAYAPRELEDYCKLVKKFPRAERLTAINGITPKNAKSAYLLGYLRDDDAPYPERDTY